MEHYIHPDDQPMVWAKINTAIQTKSHFELEHRVRRLNGALGWTSSRAVPILDEDGEITEWIGAASDISARKGIEEELRESMGKYRALFESIDQGFCVVEVLFDNTGKANDFRYLKANTAYRDHVGLIDPVGSTLREAYPGAESVWPETFGRIARTGEGERFVDFTEAVNRWFDIFAFPTGEPHQNRVGILFQDITERKRAEAALRDSEEQQAFLLKLSDALRPLSDPIEVQRTAMDHVAAHFSVESAVYVDFEPDGDHAKVREGHHSTRISFPPVLRLSDFGQALVDDLNAGRTIPYEDVEADPRLAANRDAFRALNIRSGVGVPMIAPCATAFWTDRAAMLARSASCSVSTVRLSVFAMTLPLF